MDLAAFRALGGAIRDKGAVPPQGLSLLPRKICGNSGKMKGDSIDLGLIEDTTPIAALRLTAVKGGIAGVRGGKDLLVYPYPFQAKVIILRDGFMPSGIHYRPQSLG
jgi:hypothetical protein